MAPQAVELREIVRSFYGEYSGIDEVVSAVKLSPDAWSLREIMGHLIDSASNNHQRFVRMQREEHLVFPAYHYTWVETERFNEMAFRDIMDLWRQYNGLLTHIIGTVDDASLLHIWGLDDGGSITLEALIIDYLRHLKEHLGQFEERLAAVRRSRES